MSRYTRDDSRYWTERPADHNAAGLFVDGPQMARGRQEWVRPNAGGRALSPEVARTALQNTIQKLPRHLRVLAQEAIRSNMGRTG
jgi:hypothetical protein